MESKNSQIKEECYFKDKCFRRNPKHFQEFSHSHIECLVEEPNSDSPSILKLQYNIIKNLKDCAGVMEEVEKSNAQIETSKEQKEDVGKLNEKTENAIDKVEVESQNLDSTQKCDWRPFETKGESFELHRRFPDCHMLGLKDGSVPTPPPSRPRVFFPNNQEYPWKIQKCFKCPLCNQDHTPPSSPEFDN